MARIPSTRSTFSVAPAGPTACGARWGVATWGAVVLAGSALACGGSDPPDGAIRLGVITSESGDLAVYAADLRDALRLAVDEINAGGGVLGRPVELDSLDDGTTADGAAMAYTRLLADDVRAVIGPAHSPGVLAIADQIRSGKTLTISGTVTAGSIARLDDGGYFFRTIPSDEVQAVVLAQRIHDAGCHHLCIVHRSDTYGGGLAEAVRARLDREVMVVESAYDPAGALNGVLEPCAQLRDAEDAGVLFVTFQADGKVILNDAADRGWTTAKHRVFLVDAVKNQRLLEELRHVDALDGVVGTSPSGPDPASPAGARHQRFLDRFMTAFGRVPAAEMANHYDAAYVAALAIELAGDAGDRDGIREAVGHTSTGAAVEAGDWASARAAIAADHQLDYQGASGEVELDPTSGELRPPYSIGVWTIDGGQIVDREVVIVRSL